MCACLPDGKAVRGKSQLDCKHVKITRKEKALGRSYSNFQYQKKASRELKRDLLQGCGVNGKRRAALNWEGVGLG